MIDNINSQLQILSVMSRLVMQLYTSFTDLSQIHLPNRMISYCRLTSMYVHIPTDNVYSANRRARTSQLNFELSKPNINHERKLTMQGYSEGLEKTGDLEHYILLSIPLGLKDTISRRNWVI